VYGLWEKLPIFIHNSTKVVYEQTGDPGVASNLTRGTTVKSTVSGSTGQSHPHPLRDGLFATRVKSSREYLSLDYPHDTLYGVEKRVCYASKRGETV
jgi:hypothetical protein